MTTLGPSFISSPEPKAQGELIVWDSSRLPCVRPCILASVRPHFQTLSTALAMHHANGDASMVTEIVKLCPIM